MMDVPAAWARQHRRQLLRPTAHAWGRGSWVCLLGPRAQVLQCQAGDHSTSTHTLTQPPISPTQARQAGNIGREVPAAGSRGNTEGPSDVMEFEESALDQCHPLAPEVKIGELRQGRKLRHPHRVRTKPDDAPTTALPTMQVRSPIEDTGLESTFGNGISVNGSSMGFCSPVPSTPDDSFDGSTASIAAALASARYCTATDKSC